MPPVGLRGVLFVSFLLLLSTNPVHVSTSDLQTNPVHVTTSDLQTNPAGVATQSMQANPSNVATQSMQTQEKETKVLPKVQNNLNNWKDKSAIIIRCFPGLLTRNFGGTFSIEFLDPKEAKIVKNMNKEYRKITAEKICKSSKRIARAKLKQMKSQMKKQGMQGILTSNKNVFKHEPPTKPDCPQENQIVYQALSQLDKAYWPKIGIQSLFLKEVWK